MMYRLTEGLSARNTRLHFAIEGTKGDEVLRLLELGADVRAKDWDGNTPLHLAAACHRWKEMTIQFDRCERDYWDHLDDSSEIEREIQSAKRLLEGNPDWYKLKFNAKYTESAIVEELLKHGADVKAKDRDGNTPLHLAAQGGNIKVVEILLQHGADLINAKNEDGNTPLHKAVIERRPEVVKLLLQKEADLTVTKNDGMSVLHSALTWRTLNAIQRKRNLETIKILLEHDANLLKAEDNKDQTPLLKLKDEDGQTPLHFAITFEDPEALKLLLNAKADPKAADNKGNTPLHFAAALGHIDMVELLLEKGADPTIKNHDGKTAYTLTEGSYNLEEQAQYNPILSLLENALQKTDNSQLKTRWFNKP